MGIDQPALQLILNVVTTTAATSLALICYLLKLDNQRLTAELHLRKEQAQSLPNLNAPRKIGSETNCLPAPASNAVEPVHQNIREYVKRRSQDWNGVLDAR